MMATSAINTEKFISVIDTEKSTSAIDTKKQETGIDVTIIDIKEVKAFIDWRLSIYKENGWKGFDLQESFIDDFKSFTKDIPLCGIQHFSYWALWRFCLGQHAAGILASVILLISPTKTL